VRFLSTRKGGFLSTRKGGFLSTRAGCFVATFARRTRLEYLRVFASNSAESFTQRLVTCRSPCTLMKTLCESFGHSLRQLTTRKTFHQKNLLPRLLRLHRLHLDILPPPLFPYVGVKKPLRHALRDV
jgi:hypothetical protein